MYFIELVNREPQQALENSSEIYRWARKVAASTPKTSKSAFISLNVFEHVVPAYQDRPPSKFTTLENPRSENLPFLSELISRCWQALSGYSHPERAQKIVSDSRHQIRRAFLFDSLIDYCYSKLNQATISELQKKYLAALEQTDIESDNFIDPYLYVPCSPFVSHIEIIQAWATNTEEEIYEANYSYTPRQSENELKDLFYGTALVWLDKALALGTSDHCTNLIGAASYSMHRASLVDGLQLAEMVRKKEAAKHGLKGARLKHSKTDELKQWALAQVQGDNRLPKELAKRLVLEIPQRLQNASNDPQRLIYETLLAERKRNRLARQG